MPSHKHLDLLKQGVRVWNTWRDEHPRIQPKLSNAFLRRFDLRGANLSGADLSFANLSESNLESANLSRAALNWSDVCAVNFKRADLSFADLTGVDAQFANFMSAKLIGAELIFVDFNEADLRWSDFSQATIGWSRFTSNNLNVVNGLEAVNHIGPSQISIDTIYRSKGSIPEIFLRGTGMPDSFLRNLPLLAEKPFDFYSYFISYSSKDQLFAERLYADLQSKGVRCWFAPEDLRIGEKMRTGLDEHIRRHDKLLVILSKFSINSEWVGKEVETALEEERKQNRVMLFPVRLDNSILKIDNGWSADIKRIRHIGDFRKWKDHDSYQKALIRLLRDLKVNPDEPVHKRFAGAFD